MIGNFKKAKVTVNNVKIIPNEYLEGEKIAEISYTVSFQLPSKLTHGPEGDTKK